MILLHTAGALRGLSSDQLLPLRTAPSPNTCVCWEGGGSTQQDTPQSNG
jgi:hypothetical protein